MIQDKTSGSSGGSPTIDSNIQLPPGFDVGQNPNDPEVVKEIKAQYAPKQAAEFITFLHQYQSVQNTVGFKTDVATVSDQIMQGLGKFANIPDPGGIPNLKPGDPVNMGSPQFQQVQKWLENSLGTNYFMAMYTMAKLEGTIQAVDRTKDAQLALSLTQALLLQVPK